MKFKLLIVLCIIGLILTSILLFLNFKNKTNNAYINLYNKQRFSWGVKDINAPALWSKTTGKNVKIAVMDSGIDLKHSDLNVKDGFNAISPNKPSGDSYTHGTAIAGIISARNNDIGIVGIAPDAKVYSVKVLDEYGEGDIIDICKGIDWCIENNIKIINMSFSILKDDTALYNSIQKAINAGIIIVASASNNGQVVGYPASYKDVISVTAIDKDHKVNKNSPKGKIDFAAPGFNIISTLNGDKYYTYDGTSIATAHVTGIIALILEKPGLFDLKSNYSNNDIKNVLIKHCEQLGDRKIYGNGFITFTKRRG